MGEKPRKSKITEAKGGALEDEGVSGWFPGEQAVRASYTGSGREQGPTRTREDEWNQKA